MKVFSEVHRRYSRMVNFREGWRGHLWQGRYFSYPMDMPHSLLASRYIELNPVTAKMVVDFADYTWSSAQENLGLTEKRFKNPNPLLDIVENWREFILEKQIEIHEEEKILLHTQTGRPIGDEEFIKHLERIVGRRLRPNKPGPKPKTILIP